MSLLSRKFRNKNICLGNIWRYFTKPNMKKRRSKKYVHTFSVDYNIIDTSDILDIHQKIYQIYIY